MGIPRNASGRKRYVKLRFSNWSMVPKRTLSMAMKFAEDGLIDLELYLTFLPCNGLTANPHLFLFGEADVVSLALDAQILKHCRSPDAPEAGELREIFGRLPVFRKYFGLESAGRDWTLKLKVPKRAFRARDWVARDWLAMFVDGGGRNFFPVAGRNCQVFFELQAMLNGDRTMAEVLARYPRHGAFVKRFFRFARQRKLLEFSSEPPVAAPSRVGVEYLSHSCLAFHSGADALLIDPCFFQKPEHVTPGNVERINRSLAGIRGVRAILISHNHWDHCHLQTLVRFPRDLPVYVPRNSVETPFNPSIAGFLRSLGFRRVREVDSWQRKQIGPFGFLPVPFHGEWFGPESEFDGFCYLIETAGRRFLGTVDSDRNDRGNMTRVFRELRKRVSRIDYMFFCSSEQAHTTPFSCGAPFNWSNTFGRRYPEKMRYHPDVRAVREWCRILKPGVIIPYAEFIFHNDRVRPPHSLDSAEDADRVFREYWRASVGATDGELRKWKKSLAGLARGVRAAGTRLLMLGPGEFLGRLDPEGTAANTVRVAVRGASARREGVPSGTARRPGRR